MTDFQLHKEINSLPPDLKKEVEDFVAFLKTKNRPGIKIKQRTLGMRGISLKCRKTSMLL